MKLFNIVMLLLIQTIIWSEEIEVGIIHCNASSNEELTVHYSMAGNNYTDSDVILLYYTTDYMTMAFSFDEEGRTQLNEVLAKVLE